MVEDFALGAFTLQSGQETTGLKLRYETHGRLDQDKSNAILFPTWFAGRHAANRWIIGPGRALDTDKFFVIVVNCFGNGESSSPSNAMELGGPDAVSLLDNVRAQHRLVRGMGIQKLHAVVGRSMGAQQALQWACVYPSGLGRAFAFCGLPRTTPHNKLLLESVATPLASISDPGEALIHAARAYGAWAFSHQFLQTHESVEAYVQGQVVQSFAAFAPQDLMMLLRTWQAADVSANPTFNGNLASALGAIEVPTFLMPISHDMLFPAGEFTAVAGSIRNVRLHELRSDWGHRAAAPGGTAQDIHALETALAEFLDDRPHTAWDCAAMGNMHPL